MFRYPADVHIFDGIVSYRREDVQTNILFSVREKASFGKRFVRTVEYYWENVGFLLQGDEKRSFLERT